ncbi:MAG: hypothetical protein WC282_00120 [Bacilli bacterium]
MKKTTRVEKYQKLREEIAHMPIEEELSSAETKEIYLKTLKPKDGDDASSGINSTQGFPINEILNPLGIYSESAEKEKPSPIDRQKRKEMVQVIVLLSILVVLLIGVVVLGVYAF